MNEDEKIINLLKDTINALNSINPQRITADQESSCNATIHSLIKVLKLKADEKYPCRYEMPDYWLLFVSGR
ncbi:hypothetical protein D1W72_10170 [Salmonella enterica]|nr:hypothetical protein [Salmonella enterica]